MGALACINGEFMHIEKATIPIEDRGFQLGDGIYEVVIVYRKRIFMLEPHLERLEESARLIHLPIGYSREEIESLCYELLEKSGMEEGQIYLQVTRGVYPRQHNMPEGIPSTLVMTIRDRPEVPTHVHLLTMEDIRWDLCMVKAIDLLPNLLAKRRAREAHCHEALFIRRGRVLEGASNNLFIVRGGLVMTPPLSKHILKGVTREVVLDICRRKKIPYAQKDITREELLLADEVFLTGSLFEVRPVTRIDGYTIGDGRLGMVTEEVQSSYSLLTKGVVDQ